CLWACPQHRAARLLAARTARRLEDFSEALRHLRLYEQQHGDPAEVELEYRLHRIQQGDAEELNRAFDSCEASPDSPHTSLLLEVAIEAGLRALIPAFFQGTTVSGADSLARGKRVRRAVDLWLQLSDGAADRAQGLVWRGRLHFYMNEPNLAIDD